MSRLSSLVVFHYAELLTNATSLVPVLIVTLPIAGLSSSSFFASKDTVSGFLTIIIGIDTVVAKKGGWMLVGNWRTGDARVIVIEPVSTPFP